MCVVGRKEMGRIIKNPVIHGPVYITMTSYLIIYTPHNILSNFGNFL